MQPTAFAGVLRATGTLLFMDVFFVFMVIGVIILVALGIAAAVRAERNRKRRQAVIVEWAKANGLRWDFALKAHQLKYPPFSIFMQGKDRAACLRVSGSIYGRNFDMFDYEYFTEHTDNEGRKSETHHLQTVLLIQNSANIPSLLAIRREHFGDKLLALVGKNDINFESQEFSRRFHVSCDNRKLAFDIVHALFMEHMLRHPNLSVSFWFNWALVTAGSGLLPAEQWPATIEAANRLLDLTPDYVRADPGRYATP